MPEEDDIDQMVRLCRIKAEAKAVQGQSIVGVAAVFRQRGVPAERADREAEQIVAEAREAVRKRELPRKIIGWGLIAFGVGFVLLGLVGSLIGANDGSETIIYVPGGLILLGALVLWGDQVFRKS